MHNISKISKWTRVLLALAVSIELFIWMAFSFYPEASLKLFFEDGFPPSDIFTSNSWREVSVILEETGLNSFLILGAAYFLPDLLIFLLLFKLFGSFQKGLFFTTETITYIKNIGLMLFALLVLDFFFPATIMLFLYVFGVIEHGSIPGELGLDDIRLCLLALSITALAHIMRKAFDLKKEQELVI